MKKVYTKLPFIVCGLAVTAALVVLCLPFISRGQSGEDTTASAQGKSSSASLVSPVFSGPNGSEGLSSAIVSGEEKNSPNTVLLLHRGGVAHPAPETAQNAHERALSGLSQGDEEKVREKIRELHYYMEWQFTNNLIREKLVDPDSVYWETWERTGIFHFPGESPLEKLYDGNCLIEDLQEIIDIVRDEKLAADLKVMQQVTRKAVDQHDFSCLEELHRMLHDCDYWLINYPPVCKTPPGDWEGLKVYFGVLGSFAG